MEVNGPQGVEVTCLVGGGGERVTRLFISSLFLIDTWSDPPHVTSTVWGPPPPCNQALR